MPEQAANATDQWNAVVLTDYAESPSSWPLASESPSDEAQAVVSGALASKVIGTAIQHSETSHQPKSRSDNQWVHIAGGAFLCMTRDTLMVLFSSWYPFRHSNKTTLAVACGSAKPAKRVVPRNIEDAESTRVSSPGGATVPVRIQNIEGFRRMLLDDSYVRVPMKLSSFNIPHSVYAGGHPTVALLSQTRPDHPRRR